MKWMKVQPSACTFDTLINYGDEKTKENLTRFCKFSAERMNVYWARRNGLPREHWTEDPILQRYKFTNCYRILDRVSQYLITNISNAGSYGTERGRLARTYDRFVRTYIFKMFNSVETWEAMPLDLRDLGYDSVSTRRALKDIQKWAEARQRHTPIFGNAYLMAPPDGKMYHTRVALYLAGLEALLTTTVEGNDGCRVPSWKAIMEAAYLSTSYRILRSIRGFGPFLAYQFAMDFAYGAEYAVDFNSFVVPGPGCQRGYQKVFGVRTDAQMVSALKAMYRNQVALFTYTGVGFPFLTAAPDLQTNDFQNLFCEFDKYSRVAYPKMGPPQVAKHKIKNTFEPTAPIDAAVVPRNW